MHCLEGLDICSIHVFNVSSPNLGSARFTFRRFSSLIGRYSTAHARTVMAVHLHANRHQCTLSMHVISVEQRRVATAVRTKFQPTIVKLVIIFQPFCTIFTEIGDLFPAFPASLKSKPKFQPSQTSFS